MSEQENINNNQDTENKLTSVHTLESDLASVIRDKDYGKNIIKIVTDPNKKIDFENSSVVDKYDIYKYFNKKNIIILIVIFLLIGGFTAWYFLYKKNTSNTNTDIDQTGTDLSTSTEKNIISKNILKPEVLQYSDFSKFNKFEIVAEIEKIKQLLLDKKIEPSNNIGIETNLDTIKFFEKIRYSGNDSFLRSLNNNEYAFGLYSLKNDTFETYLLIKVDTFDLSFKSILDWETYMPSDLKDIFIGNNEIKEKNAESASTTLNGPKLYYKKNTASFVDKILKNYDIREYVSNENNIDLIYGFINNKYLLITSGESSFIDIKDKLLKENISR